MKGYITFPNNTVSTNFSLPDSSNLLKSPTRAISPRKISLLNFNPNDKRNCFLTSPRSVEACRRLGIEEHELTIKTAQDLAKEHIPIQFKDNVEEFIETKRKFYEHLRQKRVTQCIEMRNRIENSGNKRYVMNTSDNKDAINESEQEDSNLYLDTERELEMWKKRQEKDIEKIVESANRLNSIQARHEYAKLKILEMEEEKRQYFEKRRKTIAQARAQWETAKKGEGIKREEIRMLFQGKKFEQEKKWKEKQDWIAQQRFEEAKTREQKRREKVKVVSVRIEENEKRKKHSADLKKEIMEKKFENVERLVLEKRNKLAQRAEEQSKKFQRRLSEISQYHEEKKNKTWERYTQKMKKSEEARQKLEEDKLYSIDFKRVQGILKAREIKNSYMNSDDEGSVRQTENTSRIEDNPDFNKIMEQVRWRHTHGVLESGVDATIREKLKKEEEIREARKRALFQQIETNSQRAERKRIELLGTRKINQIMHYLKEEEAKAHSERKEKADKYKSERTMEKVVSKNQKILNRIFHKESIMRENASRLKQYRIEKDKLKDDFERMRSSVDSQLYKSMYNSPGNLSVFNTTQTTPFVTELADNNPKANPESAFIVKKKIIKTNQPQIMSQPPIIIKPRTSETPKKPNRNIIERKWAHKPQEREKKGQPYLFNVMNGSFGIMTNEKPQMPKLRQSFDLGLMKKNTNLHQGNLLNNSARTSHVPSSSRIRTDEIQDLNITKDTGIVVSNINNSEEQVSQIELTGIKDKSKKKERILSSEKSTIIKSFQSDLHELQKVEEDETQKITERASEAQETLKKTIDKIKEPNGSSQNTTERHKNFHGEDKDETEDTANRQKEESIEARRQAGASEDEDLY